MLVIIGKQLYCIMSYCNLLTMTQTQMLRYFSIVGNILFSDYCLLLKNGNYLPPDNNTSEHGVCIYRKSPYLTPTTLRFNSFAVSSTFWTSNG